MKNKNDAKQHDDKGTVSKKIVDSQETSAIKPEASAVVERNDNVSDAIEADAQQKMSSVVSQSDSKVSEQAKSTVTPSTSTKISKLAVLCLLLIVVIAGIGGWGFYSLSNAVNNEQQRFTELTANNNRDIEAAKVELQQKFSQQTNQFTAQVETTVQQQQQTIEMLKEKVTELAGRRPNDWLLAEANYLVKLAGRKLWQEKDIDTARSLLTTADMRINEMNEPSLVGIRQALASDIASLQALPRDNSETLALKLDGLISQVDNLKLNMIKLPEITEGQDPQQLSESAEDWQDNLKRMWDSFSDGFITVRRRNGSVEPLMSPKQQWYLEENLKRKLMQTQLAVYRQQQTAYVHAIELSTRWILQFYDRQDSTTEFMLNELANLKKEQVSVNYPQNFNSSNLIIDALLQRNVGYNNTVDR